VNTNRPDPETLLDAAVAAVRDEPIDPQTLAAARARVARRLEAELAPAVPGEVDHRIRGCDGFQALVPVYFAGALAEPKRILFEDHTRECVPCRRALYAARKGARRAEAPAAGRGSRRVLPPWAKAAALVAVAAGAAAWLAFGAGLVGPEARAKVKTIDGELLLVAGDRTVALAAGATVERGAVVRTASGSSAILLLADGSAIELGERTELSLDRRTDGVVVAVDRGELIVEAAERKRGRLYVATDELTAAVTGTIFAVDSGVRGSRVAVLDGEVEVRQGARRAVLRAGEQHASGRLGRASLESEFGWSRNAVAYRERIAALAALGRELDATLAAPAARTSTRLLELAPAGTAVWVALPNLSGQLGEAWALLERRVAENPVLADWWADRFGAANSAEIGEAIERLRSLGHGLGEEIAVAVTLGADGRCGTPVVLAEIADRGFAGTLDAEIARLDAEATAAGRSAPLRRVASPAEAGGEGALWIWIADGDLLVASPSADGLRSVESALAAGSPFAGTPFYARLAEVYAGGAGWLLAVDAARVLATVERAARAASHFERLGLAAAEQFLVESEPVEGGHQTSATLAFVGPRTGVASWLAAPASSGALEFVSANAQLAVSALVKRPEAMFDDLWTAIVAENGAQAESKRAELERKLGFSLRDDLAAAFGGDVAFALDGPWLPKPSWKLVVELADAGRLETVAERAVAAIDAEAKAHGRPGVRLSQEESDGRIFYRLATEAGAELVFATVVDGYLVAAPSKALVVEAIAHRAAGTTLAHARAFRDRLPSDVDADFSAMLWQNLGGTLGQLGQLFAGEASPEARAQLEALAAESGPTLVVAYGGRDTIGFVARGQSGPLGFSFEKLLSLLGAVAGVDGGPSDPGAAAADETPLRASA
jgi:hypothetical protein